MFEDIQKHRQAVAENIEKSLQIGYTESEDLEKAHNVGDVHPNGKWVWTQLPSGKYDWRVIKKTQNPVSGNVSTQQAVDDAKAKMAAGVAAKKQTSKSSVNGANTFDDVLAEYKNGGNAVQTFDGKAYNLLEYENYKNTVSRLKQKDRDWEKQLTKNNIRAIQSKIDDTKKNHSGARAVLVKLNQDMAKYNSRLKVIEDIEEELKNRKIKSKSFKIVPDYYIQHGNLSAKDFKDLYQKAYDSYKDEDLEKIYRLSLSKDRAYKNNLVYYDDMKKYSKNKAEINKQGNYVDKLAAEKYILYRLWESQQIYMTTTV